MNASTFFRQFLWRAVLYFVVWVVAELVRRLVFPTADAWTWFDIQAAFAMLLGIAWVVVQRRRTRS